MTAGSRRVPPGQAACDMDHGSIRLQAVDEARTEMVRKAAEGETQAPGAGATRIFLRPVVLHAWLSARRQPV